MSRRSQSQSADEPVPTAGQASSLPAEGCPDAAAVGTNAGRGRQDACPTFTARSENGVALVITLIMLSVITFLAVAFLALTRRERAAVTVTVELTDAKLMADAALARAQSELVARFIARNSHLDYDLTVSTNFINHAGFVSGSTNFDNVNYEYLQGGGALTPNDFIQNVANLFYDPRPPVYVITNDNLTDPADFRFYLDFNRSARFDTNGVVMALDDALNPLAEFLAVGDPEWIGVLERPDRVHAPDNRFVGRYAFLVQPASKSLDLNFIHNQAKWSAISTVPTDNGFLRNQGFGSWEINQAAFLHTLNTNFWPDYQYVYTPLPFPTTPSLGVAFVDATALLNYRYDGTYQNLETLAQHFGVGALAVTELESDFIDGFANGPLMTGLNFTLAEDDNQTGAAGNWKWAGSDITNQYFDVQELFSLRDSLAPGFPGSVQAGLSNFTDRLDAAGRDDSSYDRYTFYRLLAQMGTDSDPAGLARKINLNYLNANSAGTNSFLDWTPKRFFTNVAHRLIRSNLVRVVNAGVTNYYIGDTEVRPNIGIDSIQIWPTNEYTGTLHRLLQLAANLYDATTNRGATYPYLPTVFRPQFAVSNMATEVYIADYEEVLGTGFLSNPWRDVTDPAQRLDLAMNTNYNAFGVPIVIGAKKGYPNFNEFSLKTEVEVTRKLELRKASVNDQFPLRTNQMYVVRIDNLFDMEFWNSYTNPPAFPRALRLEVFNQALISLTNQAGTTIWPGSGNPQNLNFVSSQTIPAGMWPGWQAEGPSFRVVSTNSNFLSNSVYRHGAATFIPANQNSTFEVRPLGEEFYLPDWGLVVTNRIRAWLIDDAANRIVDLVNITNTQTFDITETLTGDANLFSDTGTSLDTTLWETNRIGGDTLAFPTRGIREQIRISLDPNAVSNWRSYDPTPPIGPDKDKAIQLFRTFMGLAGTNRTVSRVHQTPFNPSRHFVRSITLQVNDPLVHYTFDDLRDPTITNLVNFIIPPRIADARSVDDGSDVGALNRRYRPWGGRPAGPGSLPDSANDEHAYDLFVKDPLIRGSDDWAFPNEKFANIGWIGRVHRGTPWQTVYLKAPDRPNQQPGDQRSPFLVWANWAGRSGTYPTNDWSLPDLFTVAPNENAVRGLLSVNQTNLAAWSAVLSGVDVVSNSVPDNMVSPAVPPEFVSFPVDPVFDAARIQAIVEGLINTRAAITRPPAGAFTKLGDILRVPELTVNSPFLNLGPGQREYGINDAAYERIPQMILSLLKVEDEPRVVVYAFGQSLKPAPNSLIVNPFAGTPAGSAFQLCTNYQITGEVVTRTVLRFTREVDDTVDPPVTTYKAVVESYNQLPNP